MKDHIANRDGISLSRQDFGNRAGSGCWNFDGRLVGHDFDHRLMFFNTLPFGHEPLNDFTLGDAFSNVGQLEFDHDWCVTLEACDFLDCVQDATLIGQVVVFERIREGRIEAGHTPYWSFHVLDDVLRDKS